MSKGPYRTAAPGWVSVLGIEKRKKAAPDFSGTALVETTRRTTFASPSAEVLFKKMLLNLGTPVDRVDAFTDQDLMLQIRAFRQTAGEWKVWCLAVPEQELLMYTYDREALLNKVCEIARSLHRLILRTDREGFPGTYSERDLEATLV